VTKERRKNKQQNGVFYKKVEYSILLFGKKEKSNIEQKVKQAIRHMNKGGKEIL